MLSKIKSIFSIIFYALYGATRIRYLFLSWWWGQYLYFILLSSTNRKYKSFVIVYGKVIKQRNALYVLLSYHIISWSYHITSHHINILPHHIIPHQTTSYHVKSYIISISYHITPHHTTSSVNYFRQKISLSPSSKWFDMHILTKLVSPVWIIFVCK